MLAPYALRVSIMSIDRFVVKKLVWFDFLAVPAENVIGLSSVINAHYNTSRTRILPAHRPRLALKGTTAHSFYWPMIFVDTPRLISFDALSPNCFLIIG